MLFRSAPLPQIRLPWLLSALRTDNLLATSTRNLTLSSPVSRLDSKANTPYRLESKRSFLRCDFSTGTIHNSRSYSSQAGPPYLLDKCWVGCIGHLSGLALSSHCTSYRNIMFSSQGRFCTLWRSTEPEIVCKQVQTHLHYARANCLHHCRH